MTIQSATAIAHPNIAFIKYWGNRDQSLRLPENGSISMNLEELTTRTQVTFDPGLPSDILDLNGNRQTGTVFNRVVSHMNLLRGLRGIATRAYIKSENNFPEGTGIASSASAFAALTVAAVRALGIALPERDLSRLARRGSGSACRSIPGGFVEWYPGSSDVDSYAVPIAKSDYWNLVDCIAILNRKQKATGSTEGHALAKTSPLQSARVLDAPRRLERCRDAIQTRDFDLFAETIEQDCLLMHAVMLTSLPALVYWQPATLELIQAVKSWRKSGIPVAFTIDAGPNVHVICEEHTLDLVKSKLKKMENVEEIIIAHPGECAQLA
jgi:diphosphomevalonate decarboxylase